MALFGNAVLFGLPVLAGVYASVAFRRGGARRLWRDDLIAAVVLAALALWQPDVLLYHHSRRAAAGIESWALPGAVIAAAFVTHALGLLRAPVLVGVFLASAAAWLVLSLGVWIA